MGGCNDVMIGRAGGLAKVEGRKVLGYADERRITNRFSELYKRPISASCKILSTSLIARRRWWGPGEGKRYGVARLRGRFGGWGGSGRGRVGREGGDGGMLQGREGRTAFFYFM